MCGRHSLTTSNVGATVDNKIGVYKLYNSRSGPVRFVGMSTNLAKRLREHVDEYSFFEFEYQSSETAAYKREANLYHHHKQKLDNERHPPRPHKRVTCPACSIHG